MLLVGVVMGGWMLVVSAAVRFLRALRKLVAAR